MAPPANRTPAENNRHAVQRQEMDQLQSSFVKIELFEGDSSEDGRQWLERSMPVPCSVQKPDRSLTTRNTTLLFGNSAYDWFEDLEEDTKGNLPLLKVAVNVSRGKQTFPQTMADFSLSVE